MNIDEYIKLKKLEEIYDRMPDEDKRQYLLSSQMDRQHKEIMDDMTKQNKDLAYIYKSSKRNNFGTNFVANIAADAVWEVFAQIFKRIKL